MAETSKESLPDIWLRGLKNRPVIAGLVVGGTVIAWFATFGDSIGKIDKFLFPPSSSASSPVPSNFVFSPTTSSVAIDNRRSTAHNGTTITSNFFAGATGGTGPGSRTIRPDVRLFPRHVGSETTGPLTRNAPMTEPQVVVPSGRPSSSASPTVATLAADQYLPDPGKIRVRITREDEKYTTRGSEMFISDIERKMVWVWDGSVNRFTRAYSYDGKLSDTPIPVKVFICGDASYLIATNENESLSAIFSMNLDNGDLQLLAGESKQASRPPSMGCYKNP